MELKTQLETLEMDIGSKIVGPPYPHILQEELSTELLLYDEEQEMFVSLNETASDVWRIVTGEFTVDEIATKLATAYETDPARVQADVEKTIAEMVEKHLLPPLR